MAGPKIALIAAQSINHVIGTGTEIPWRVKGEQKLFREITTGGTLIMGRRTFDTIGKPLPGRTTIIITRNSELIVEDCLMATSLTDAIHQATQLGDPIFVAGGGEIYSQAIGIADCLHLTTIHTTVEGEVHFPSFPDDEFVLVEEKKFESNIDYTYRYFQRSKK